MPRATYFNTQFAGNLLHACVTLIFILAIAQHVSYAHTSVKLNFYCYCLQDSNIKNSELAPKNYKNMRPIEMEPEHLRPQILENVNNCIRHHHEIMKFAQVVESEFSLLMLMQFLCSLSMVCFQLFQLSVVSKLVISSAQSKKTI